MRFFNFLDMSINRNGIDEVRFCKIVRLRFGAMNFSVLTKSAHTAGISRVAKLGVALGRLLDGQRKLLVRL